MIFPYVMYRYGIGIIELSIKILILDFFKYFFKYYFYLQCVSLFFLCLIENFFERRILYFGMLDNSATLTWDI